jgi:uncharacterized protein (DUF58 family)
MAVLFNDIKIYLLLFIVFTLTLINSYLARVNLFYLQLSLINKERFFCNTQCNLWFNLLNKSNNTSYALMLDSKEINKIDPNQSKVFCIPLKPTKRGIIEISNYTLESVFPLPHLKATKEFQNLGSILVYPKPEGKNLQESFPLSSFSQNGNDEFESIREYREGEPLSRIHWSSFAKQEKFMSKEFVGENYNDELILEYEKAGETHEKRLSQLCLWLLECEEKKLSFSLILNNGKIINSLEEDIDSMLKRLSFA